MTKSLFFALPILFSSVLAAGCATDVDPQADQADQADQEDDDVAVGTESEVVTKKLARRYGGPHLGLALTATGGNLSFDCASGSLTAPLRLDANGRFSVAGTFRRGSGVHRPPGINPPPLQTIQYKGQVTGTKMAIRFTLDGVTQRFTLTANADSQLRLCF